MNQWCTFLLLVVGVVALSGSMLSQTLSSLKTTKSLFLEEKEGNLELKTNETTVLLKTISYEDFPLIPRIEAETKIKIKVKELILGIKSVVNSAALSTIRPELGSIYIYQETNTLVFVATDAFRLAEKKIVVKQIEQFPSILIPYKNALEIVRLFDGVDEEVDLLITKNQISLEGGGVFITSRVVDGVFPDYTQIIPKEYITTVLVLKQDILNGIKSLSVFSDKFNQILFTVHKEGVTLETKNNDVGEGKTLIVGKVTGETLTRKFNQKYITDAFSTITDDSVLLSFADERKPLVIEGASNKSFKYLVMPMNN
jgi:DNA polymerase-3 subunit beta